MTDNNILWKNLQLVTLTNNGEPYGCIKDAAISSKHGRIAWLGTKNSIPEEKYTEEIDCGDRYLTPGLIDCHTHLVYGGERVTEYEKRLNGMSYEEIARQGGGILSTVKDTRKTNKEQLTEQAKKRIQQFIMEGVTTMEIKSGYGLEMESEIKMLEVIQVLGKQLPIHIEATFLGAHAIPQDYQHDVDAYIGLICNEMLPAIAQTKLATAVDGFCEKIAFSREQITRVLNAAKDNNLHTKLHADQMSDTGSAELAASFHALSADHLEYTSEVGVRAMAASGTIAVLLPGAFYTLRETKLPPMDLFRQYKVPIAIASDSNPGSSPMLSLRLMLNMACTLFDLSPEEALHGACSVAAKALGLAQELGTLEVGKQADFSIWDINHPAELVYYAGGDLCYKSYKAGNEIII